MIRHGFVIAYNTRTNEEYVEQFDYNERLGITFIDRHHQIVTVPEHDVCWLVAPDTLVDGKSPRAATAMF